MRNAGGAFLVTNRDGSEWARDTFTCAHGNEIVRVQPGAAAPKYEDGDPVEHCLCCKKPICKKCCRELNLTLKCVPFERRLEAMEARGRFRAALTG